ncbi:MAG: carboxypeptidase-like regulatory domain-containing protein [Oceanococcaceae bacterium]
MRNVLRGLLVLCAVLVSLPGIAHGLLVQAEADGRVIQGRVWYSDGQPAAGEFVALHRAPATATDTIDPTVRMDGAATDADGRFTLRGEPGAAHVLIAYGVEGHQTRLAITLDPGARARLTDNDNSSDGLPAWVLLGAVLGASLIPALWLRRRGRGSQA